MNQLTTTKSILPSTSDFAMMKEMASMAVASGLIPSSINTPQKALIIMMKGREINIPPMMALSHISVINGKPCMSAELMLAKIYENVPNAIIDLTSTTDTECVIIAQRPGGAKTRFSFTIEDARVAGLLGKGPWKTYPAAMLRARAISAMARALFPDAINGVSYTPEELGANVEIDDAGNETVKDVTPAPVVPKPDFSKPEVSAKMEQAPKSVQNEVIEHTEDPLFTAEEIAEVNAATMATKATEEPLLPNEAMGEYVIVGGKYNGKKLKEIKKEELYRFISDILSYEKKGNTLPTEVVENVFYAKKYLGLK